MAFDIASVESGVLGGLEEKVAALRAELAQQADQEVLGKLHEAKSGLLSQLEEVKNDLNQVDAAIASRTPQPEVTEEAAPTEG